MKTLFIIDSGMVRRRTVLGSVGGIAAAGLAGCLGDGGIFGGGDSVPEEAARLWYARSDAEARALEDDVETFNDETDHELYDEELAELEDGLTSSIPADDGPELFGWAHDWVGDFHERGFLYDVSGDLETDLEETFTEAAVEAVQFEDHLYGLPYAAETVALLYNEELVEEPPETVDEMVEIMEDHHDPGAGAYGLSYPLDPYFISAWPHAFGGFYFDDETEELGLTQQETLDGFEFIVENFWPYQPQDPDYDAQAAAFADGNTPFAINGPWAVGDFSESVDVGVAPLPTPEGGEAAPYTGIQMWYFSSMMEEANDDRRDAARAFVDWHTTHEEITLEMAESHFFIPVQEELIDHPDLPEEVQAYAETVENGIPMPTNPRMNRVWDPVEDAFVNYLNEDQELEEAFEEAEAEIRDGWDEQDDEDDGED